MTTNAVRSFLESLPPIRRIAAHVAAAAERRIGEGHPWIYADHFRPKKDDGRPGDLAVVFDRREKFVAIGLLDPTSPLRVRILARGSPRPIDALFWSDVVGRAIEKRADVARANTGYRILYGENDGTPGLCADRYDENLVVKIYSPAWLPHLFAIDEAIRSVFPVKRIVLRVNRSTAAFLGEDSPIVDGACLFGPPLEGPVRFLENGLVFEADLVRGQKTGFFLDQRDNRSRVETLAAKKDVLNVCAYSGGFSLYAARGGARSVVSLDMSRGALAGAERNFDLNRSHPAIAATRHEILVADAFSGMADLASEGRTFDMVILDPPSFAQRKSDVDRALDAYRRLSRLGAALLRRDGILVACSCSTPVAADEFFAAVKDGVAAARCTSSLIEKTFHAADHPVTFPEGAYLKAIFSRISPK